MKRTNALLGFLVLLVLALLVAAGYFLTKPYAAQAPRNSLETKLVDLPANWKNYAGLGFSISYPNDWVLDKSSEDKGMIWLRSKERQADVDAQKIVRVFDVAVTAQEAAKLPDNEKDKLPLAEWVKNKAEDQGFTKVEPYVLGGVSGFQGQMENPEVPGAFNLMEMVEKGGKVFVVEVEGEMTPEKEQILRSFRLLK